MHFKNAIYDAFNSSSDAQVQMEACVASVTREMLAATVPSDAGTAVISKCTSP